MKERKRLILIMEDGEGNASLVHERVRDLGGDVIVLKDSDFGETWDLKALGSNTESLAIVDKQRGATYSVTDGKSCFYFRSPHYGHNPRLALPYSYFLSHLYSFGYENGSSLYSRAGTSLDKSKPLNLSLHQGMRVPGTRLGNDLGWVASSSWSTGSVVKGISGVRTEAVSGTDPRLNFQGGRGHAMVQQRILGQDVKVVFYRKQNSDWVVLPTIAKPQSKIDYRYASELKLERLNFDYSWPVFAEGVHQMIKARFFDADFKLTDDGLVFLEVNLGASGIGEEKAIGDSAGAFSKAMYSDWLNL